MLVTGGGDINLRNEALNLFLRGQPKELRLSSSAIAHKISVPVHPDIGLDPAKVLGQAGAALVGNVAHARRRLIGIAMAASPTPTEALIDQTVQGEQLTSANDSAHTYERAAFTIGSHCRQC